MTMNLKHFTGLKLFPSEQILDVQREHWLIIAVPIGLIFSLIFLIIITLPVLFAGNFLEQKIIFILAVFLSILAISLLLNLATYSFLQWFYQFYIITTKRMAHIHYFRFGGFHLDEVFHRQTNPSEIDKSPENFLFDFLGIEDVYVYFKRLERPEPFVFKVPQDADVIEELLESYTLQKD